MEDLTSDSEPMAMSTLPRQIIEEIEEFRGKIDDYLTSLLSPEDFKKCRLQLGIYGIRALKDRQMVRVKVPSGRLTDDQLDVLADLVEEFATGRGHITTRQDVQMYEVPIQRAPELLRRLAEADLTTREACGNSVRNVTACPFAGVCADELFDVSPYALAVTRHFLRNPMSQRLPRKFKISFSGCRHDCAIAAIHDIGVVAATITEQGQVIGGFQLYVGGGLGALPKAAQLLESFTPVEQLLPTCEAIVRVFDQHGERKDKSRARMKFLLERLGLDEFQRLVNEARARLQHDHACCAALPAPKLHEPISDDHRPLRWPGPPAFQQWVVTNVQPQRQPGFVIATVRLLLGDLTAGQMRQVAVLARRYSKGRVITTQWQDVCLPWVPQDQALTLFDDLARIGLALPDAQRIQDITSCPGADTCQIGITSSRGLTRAITEVLSRREYQTEDLAGIRIKISGCPNSCGQHHIADIGFFGGARSINGKLAPHYQLLVGGGWEQGAARFGQPVAKIPAKHVPEAVERLLQCYRRQREDGETFRAFVQRVGIPALQQIVEPCLALPAYAESPFAYRDWGQSGDFSLGGIGQGECAG